MKNLVLSFLSIFLFFSCSPYYTKYHNYHFNFVYPDGTKLRNEPVHFKIATKKIPIDTTIVTDASGDVFLQAPIFEQGFLEEKSTVEISAKFNPFGLFKFKSEKSSFDESNNAIIIKPIMHYYQLKVMDINNNPIKSVKISGKFKSANIESEFIDSTNSSGNFKKYFKPIKDPTYSFTDYYNSEINYKIESEGYYSYFGDLSISSILNETSKKDEITLLRPTDYFSPSFNSNLNSTLKIRIITFLDIIKLQSLIYNSILEPRSIDIVLFKNNKYLKFVFTNASVYNSIRLSKRDVASKMYEDVVLKILDPLNISLGDSQFFYGFDIVVNSHIKNFVEEYSVAQKIEYRFLFPSSEIRKYKNNDITSQALLDNSYIIMDNERIELKLN